MGGGREELDQRGRSRARGITSSWGSCVDPPGDVKDGREWFAMGAAASLLCSQRPGVRTLGNGRSKNEKLSFCTGHP